MEQKSTLVEKEIEKSRGKSRKGERNIIEK